MGNTCWRKRPNKPTESSPFPFEQLPPEIQCMIFRCLPFRDRIRLERVCKDWQQLMAYTAYSDVKSFFVAWRGDEISTGDKDIIVNSYKNSVAKISKHVKSIRLEYNLDLDPPVEILSSKMNIFRKMTSIITENDFRDLKSVALKFECPSKETIHKVLLDREAIISFISKTIEIELYGIEVAAIDVDVWQQLTQRWQKIYLFGCRVPGLQASSALRSIHVISSTFADGSGSIDIANFSGCTNIEEFRFSHNHTMLTNASAISSMTSLKVMTLHGMFVNNDDLNAIVQRCSMLTHVSLYECGTLLDQFWQLANLPMLVWLELVKQPISDNDLQRICQKCKNLQTIMLYHCENITVVTCVDNVKKLRILTLMSDTTRSVAFPRRMPSTLEKIMIEKVQIETVVSFPSGLRIVEWLNDISEKQFNEIVFGCPNLTRFAAFLSINLDIPLMQKLVGAWPKMKELLFLKSINRTTKDYVNYEKIIACHPKLRMFVNRFPSLPSKCRWIREMIEVRKKRMEIGIEMENLSMMVNIANEKAAKKLAEAAKPVKLRIHNVHGEEESITIFRIHTFGPDTHLETNLHALSIDDA